MVSIQCIQIQIDVTDNVITETFERNVYLGFNIFARSNDNFLHFNLYLIVVPRRKLNTELEKSCSSIAMMSRSGRTS